MKKRDFKLIFKNQGTRHHPHSPTPQIPQSRTFPATISCTPQPYELSRGSKRNRRRELREQKKTNDDATREKLPKLAWISSGVVWRSRDYRVRGSNIR